MKTKNLRILSLLPAATEIVYLLGLEKYLAGVSHECDFPKGALKLPKITSSSVNNDMSSREISDAVSKLKHKGNGVFHIDQKLLAKLKPNLILTQELCGVCAISWTQVKNAAKVLDGEVKIISLEPESIEDILANIRMVGEFTDSSIKSGQVIEALRKRILNLKFKILNSLKPKVLVVEWLDPVMIAGHWVPEMIEKAGGTNLISTKGQKSYPITIDQIVQSSPDIIIFAPCGFNIARTLKERFMIDELRFKIGKKPKFFLVDGNSYMTRPGPRIIDGVEILAEILHPEIFPKKHKNSDWVAYG